MTVRDRPDPPFEGIVLCGGNSSRMGRDKAFIPVDGVPMVRRVADALVRAGAGRVRVVGGDEAGLRALGLDVVPDAWPGEGPLGGIVTALDVIGPRAVAAVLSCDLLDPDPVAVAAVVARRAEADADVALPVVDGRHQWLHGAWHGRCGSILGAVFAAGARSVAAGADGLRVATSDHVGPDAVADADTPEALAARHRP